MASVRDEMKPVKRAATSSSKDDPGSFLGKLRKRRIIETLAAFIGGGWLILEFVDRLLVAHYHLPEKTIDVTFVTILGALLCTLIWRWFSSREKPRKFKLELVLIPLVLLVTLIWDINLLLHLKGPEPETVPAAKWKNSIAVLPFVDMSPQKDQEYFCDGMTEELINRLSNIKELKVPARTSVFFFKGKAQDIQEVGQKLKVNTVLEGSVRRAGNELRITAQLVNIADGYHLWSETYDRELQDIFALQDEISLQIINKLKIELLGEVKGRVVKRYTDNTEAYDSYMRGMWLLNNKITEEAWRTAILHFERAIEMDPNFSLAYVGLAGAHLSLCFWHFVSAGEAIPKVKNAFNQALKIDHELPEALAQSGLVKFNFEYDWLGGESDIRRALELNSNCGIAHARLSDILLSTGQIDKAIEESSACLESDPLSLRAQGGFALTLYLAGRYDDALQQCRKTLEIDPEYPFALAVLGQCYIQKSQFTEAIIVLQKAVAFSGNSTEYLSYLAYAYVMSGNIEKAHETLGELDNLPKSVYVSKFYLAPIYAAMGNKDRAFELLELAYKEIDANLIDLKTNPQLAVLRSDPRYEMMLRKIGL
jgi:TolB-like protein/Flp pilus assembly protein TadD